MSFDELLKRKHKLEYQTGKVLNIESCPTPENIARCHQQAQSPLFKLMPAEIRNVIFSLALLQYDDLTRPYEEYDDRKRPGHRARRVVSTSLLLTCRRVWLEANHWPMEQATHHFWCPEDAPNDDRAPWGEENTDSSRFSVFFRKLTPLQQSRVKHMQILGPWVYVKRRFIESSLWTRVRYDFPSLSTFTLTITYHGFHGMHASNAQWVHDMLRADGVGHIPDFRLEIETVDRHARALRRLLEALKSIGDIYRDNSVTHWQLIEPFEEVSWSRPTPVPSMPHARGPKQKFRITTVTWKRRNIAAEAVEQRWREEKSLLRLSDTASLASNEAEADSEANNSERQDDSEDDDLVVVDEDYEDKDNSREAVLNREQAIERTRQHISDDLKQQLLDRLDEDDMDSDIDQ